MRYLLVTVSVLCFALPAVAQEITVIQDDGSKVTVPLEPMDAMLPGEGEEAAPAEAAPVPPADKPLHVEEVTPRPYTDRLVEQPTRDEPAPEPKKSSGKKGKGAKAEKAKHPKPPRVPTQKAVKNTLPPGTEITERVATSIAMDAAPASSGFTSSRQTYQGKPVYVVTFKTDDGPYDVLVDALTGDVLVNAYVETHEQKATAPGHLPADWEPYDPQPIGKPKAAGQ